MNEIDLNEVKVYILEKGQEHRRNILLYLKWVLENYDDRKESLNIDVSTAFDKLNPFYIEGIKTKKEWNRIKGVRNNYIFEHGSAKSGWVIRVKLSYKDLSEFVESFDNNDIPEKIITWEYKMPIRNDFIEATVKYDQNEWRPSNNKILIGNKPYLLKGLFCTAVGIANKLDSPANFYMFNTHQVKKYISENFKDFQLVLDESEEDEQIITSEEEAMNKSVEQPLNQILYGPPGTGKTYNTINRALEIIFEKENPNTKFDSFGEGFDSDFEISYSDAIKLDDEDEKRKILKRIFDLTYTKNGQIEFGTFHQSYGYEEFVEGIKAIPANTEDNDTEEMTYKVVDGIFKSLVEKCTSKDEIHEENITNYGNANIWKMSLGNSQNGEDKEYYEEAVSSDALIMGYGGDYDYSECDDVESIKQLNSHDTTVGMIHRFKNELKTDDIVIISDGNRKFKAIVQVTGEYYYDKDSDLKHKRKIKWLKKFTTSRSYREISDKYFTQATLNRPKGVNKEKLFEYLSEKKTRDNTQRNYILIIDEINRGNISKIFGELITLIEPSKRIGADEEIKVKLTYSGEEFGVPSNLYIIGTMNTADRSIALMDTALRRRFEFEEMMPKPDLINGLEVDGINIQLLLEKINQRIEYLYDRDHTIGHAYFMELKDTTKQNIETLSNIFRNKIIPLLQEYFYDDWEKIQIVLGDHPEQFKKKGLKKDFSQFQFIQSSEIKEDDVLGFDHPDIENDSVEYTINFKFDVNTFIKIYGNYPIVDNKNEEEADNA
ncbi:MAG TPA: ATP/GTP-binding protein [Arcobacter sp.]|nr:ATP/GTP-binding protein [Arcobacter sp.]